MLFQSSAEDQDELDDIETTSENYELQDEQDSNIEIFLEAAAGMSESNRFTPYRIRRFPTKYKSGHPIRDQLFSEERSRNFNYLNPFLNVRDYKLARFFTETKVPKIRIDQFFQEGLMFPPGVDRPSSNISFNSAHMLNNQLSKMIVDPPWYTGFVQFPLRPKSKFSYRNILSCIEYVLKQRTFLNHMMWAPVEVCNVDQARIYSEINTLSWW